MEYIWPLNVEPKLGVIGNLFINRIYVEVTLFSRECMHQVIKGVFVIYVRGGGGREKIRGGG